MLHCRCLISLYPVSRRLIVCSFLMAQSYAGFICFLTWTSNTFARPPSKRAVALAFINAVSQLGSVAGSWVLRIIFDSSVCDSYFDEQIHVAKVLGSDVYPLLHHLHFNEHALYSYVPHLQTGARQAEQASGAARVLGSKAERIQIPTLRIIVFLPSIYHFGGSTLAPRDRVI
jgi:hypothetical protein